MQIYNQNSTSERVLRGRRVLIANLYIDDSAICLKEDVIKQVNYLGFYKSWFEGLEATHPNFN